MALIGISGKISSGKDTVGKIIQYLINQKETENRGFGGMSCIDFLEQYKFEPVTASWNIKKFADPLKDFVCMLIGCTREQLEDHEFKNKELGEGWWYTYGMKINGEERHDFLVPITEMDEYFKNSSSAIIVKLTPRMLLQQIGTEGIRDKVHPNAWVNALFADYKEVIYRTNVPIRAAGFIDTYSYPNWIITDMRFPNELEAVKSRGGITIRVNRPKNDLDNHKDCVKTEDGYCIQSENNYCKGSCKYEHPSETALDNAEFDYTIENNSSIEDLIHTVSLILKKEKII